ncbi:glutaminase [Herbiconiux sp. L3-i23]|uniref:glutaminase n=1 Tax=Herbiconiux sp. L3-i23 TaxID=2905871 RepID=UPI0020711EF3|nr:glutaminase [Herbiconiux sp. L3-i23]BDI22674.1 hypothetical protein L3i23_14500 [Herbiconiux sp. L3-i23]
MIPEELPGLLHSIALRLDDAGARTEALARLGRRRRILGVGGGPVFEPLGRVWRLGVLLLGTDGALHAAGAVTRAAEERQHGWTAVSAAERSAVRALAAQTFPVGETVNYETRPLRTAVDDSGALDAPLRIVDGEVRVEWAPGQHPVDLAAYLRERAELLLVHPEV